MLSYSEMLSLCKEVNEAATGAHFISMQEISEGKWLFDFKKGEIPVHLLFCIHHPFERFHLAPQLHGKETPFTKRVEHIFQGTQVSSVELLGEDKILSLNMQKGEKRFSIVLELIPRHGNLYLLDEKRKILGSFRKVAALTYETPAKAFAHASEPVFCTSPGVNAAYAKKEAEAAQQQKIDAAKTLLSQKVRKLKKRILSLEQEKLEADAWEAREHEATLLQSNYFKLKKGMDKIELEDWESGKTLTIKLDPLLEPSAQLKRKFGFARKLKASVPYIEKFLKKACEDLALLEKRIENFDPEQELASPVKGTKKRETVEKRAHPFREYTSESGIKIFVAKNAKQNEELTFVFGHGLDYWLHVSDFAGSHVLIRTHKGQEPDQETLLDAAQLALYYSKAKGEKVAEVTVSQVKFIGRTKKLGQVSVAKHKNLTIRTDPARLSRLNASS